MVLLFVGEASLRQLWMPIYLLDNPANRGRKDAKSVGIGIEDLLAAALARRAADIDAAPLIDSLRCEVGLRLE